MTVLFAPSCVIFCEKNHVQIFACIVFREKKTIEDAFNWSVQHTLDVSSNNL